MVDLQPCLGPSSVTHCLDCGQWVEPADIAHALESLPARMLLSTSRAAGQSGASLSATAPAAFSLSAGKNMELIGIDMHGLDPAISQHLPSHHLLLRHGLRVPDLAAEKWSS